MSCDDDAPLILYAGQTAPVVAALTDASGAPVDLTGLTVSLVAKRALADPDAEAVIDCSQDDHEDAAGGVTHLPVDLSGVGEEVYASGLRLTGSVWLSGGDGGRIPYGNCSIEIRPNAKRDWS